MRSADPGSLSRSSDEAPRSRARTAPRHPAWWALAAAALLFGVGLGLLVRALAFRPRALPPPVRTAPVRTSAVRPADEHASPRTAGH